MGAYSVLEVESLIRQAKLRLVAMVPEASYEPDYTVFQTKAAQQSYLAKRIRNRSRLEQFHFSELMTSRPIHHYAFITHADPKMADSALPGYTWPPKGRKKRSWREQMKPV